MWCGVGVEHGCEQHLGHVTLGWEGAIALQDHRAGVLGTDLSALLRQWYSDW